VDERLQQLRPLIAEAAAFAGPCIFGGDLNTNRAKWFLHAIPFPAGPVHARAVAEFMTKHGFRTPFEESRPTFDLFNLQLDWVFARGVKTGKTGIEPLDFSDHHAIWTDITFE
jgi:endonuclease/exonuclease/phosphatase (EEP) superfamily protein YafD